MAMTMAMAMALPTAATLQLRQASVAPPKGIIVMAVPKKRTSKMKKRIRKAVWMHKADKAARQALSLAKSILTGRSNSFYYETDEPAQPKCSNGDYAITEEEMNDNSDSSDEQGVKQTPRGPFKRLMLLPILAYFIGRLITYISVFWSQLVRKQPPGNMIPSFVGMLKNRFQSSQVEQQPL